jgi:hypothetical protein
LARCGARTALALIAAAGVATAQDYRARIDASAQSISFRGVRLDSIASNLVVPGADGGP